MIIRDKDQEVIELEMFHKVYLGKQNAYFNFEQYLNELRTEFNREFSKFVMNIPFRAEDSHIIVP